ncbi:MAG: hypothetical protein ACLFS9_05720 [Nitriliruptoraceae bacterium]
MQQLRTEFPFTLPKGFLDADGRLHREGTMRLATARDELEPLNDPKVSGPDDPYLTVIVLARVITRLGSLTRLSPRDIEGLFAADLAHLQDVYAIVNYGSAAEVERLLASARAGASPLAPSQLDEGPIAGRTGDHDHLELGARDQDTDEPPVSAPDPGWDAASATPVSEAARSMAGGARPAASPLEDRDAQPTPARGSRRSRIEEVGRSSGGGAG